MTLDDIDLIVFDLFGTLVEIGSRRRPFAHLRRRMNPEKASRYRRLAMTTELTLAELDVDIEGGAPTADLSLAQTAIAHEIASTRLRPGVPEMLAALPVPYGLCSNLSLDYVPTLDRFPEITPMFRLLWGPLRLSAGSYVSGASRHPSCPVCEILNEKQVKAGVFSAQSHRWKAFSNLRL